MGDLGTTFTGLSGKTAIDFGHGEASFITYMNVFTNPVSNPKMVEHVEIDSKQREVEVGDVFFTTSSETPEEVGMSSVLKEKSGVMYLNSFCFGFRPLVKFDLDYLAFMLRSESVRKQIKLLAQGISRFNISKTKMMDIEIPLSKIDEQVAIGRYFAQLDNLITLHQRKYDSLVNVKKAMLEKMFPKNGETVPEIRFKGFTDAWEQRKLGEVATEMIAGGDVDKELLLEEGHYPVIANALTNDGIVGYYNDQYRIKAPAVTVTGRGDVGHAKARNVDFTPVVRLLSIKTNHDVYFLENAINTLKIVIESTGVPQLTVPQLAKYEISFPKALKEEEKIGQYFANLDHLITLHQRKLEKLKNIKKSCLEKMFV